MENRIWLDVTTSSRWKGPDVGVIRTEKKIEEEFEKIYGERLHLFIYDSDSFREISISNKIDLIGSQTNSRNEGTNMLFPVIGRKQALKNIAQGFISLSPRAFRPFVNYLSINFSRFIKFLLRIRKDVKLRKKKSTYIDADVLKNIQSALPNQALKSHPFISGDVVVTVGTVWDYSSMLEDLYFLKKNTKLKILTLCYDLIPIRYPQYCLENTVSTFGSYLLGLAEISDVICCISYSTKKDLDNFLELAGAKRTTTKLLYLGCDISKEREEDSYPFNDGSRFILYVSTLERRKNHELLYKAYRKLIDQGLGKEIPDLYFVGMRGWGVDDLIKDIQYDPLLEGKIKILGRMSDDELDALYKKSYFVVFPSFYEGWGLAVIEAFLHGKFVLASDRGSLPEAGGVYAEYIDPYDVTLWAKKILYYSRNPSDIKKKEALIKSQWKPHKWTMTAKTLANFVSETLEDLNSVK